MGGLCACVSVRVCGGDGGGVGGNSDDCGDGESGDSGNDNGECDDGVSGIGDGGNGSGDCGDGASDDGDNGNGGNDNGDCGNGQRRQRRQAPVCKSGKPPCEKKW